MRSQVARLFTLSLVVAVIVFGVARKESNASAASANGLPQTVVELQRQMADLNAKVQQQATAIHSLQSTIQTQDRTIAELNNTVRSQGEKLQFVSVDGTEMYITGANVNIRDGSGNTGGIPTDGSRPTGLGNLIIGYNENGDIPCAGCPSQAMRPRTGSHNLVLGEFNGYTSSGGIVAGFGNSISGPFATVTGGAYSSAGGMFSSVSGGELNLASVEGAAVSGGLQGKATGRWSSVSGGGENTASAESAAVCGGSANIASGTFSTVTGGTSNKVTAQSSSISGGGFVEVDKQFAWAAGTVVFP